MLRRENTNKQLILKYAAGVQFSEPELSQFNTLKARLKYHRDLPDQLKDPNWVAKQLEERSRYPAEEVWARVVERIGEERGPVRVEEALIGEEGPSLRRPFPWRKWVAAACIVGAVAGIYRLTRPVVLQEPAPVTNVAIKSAVPAASEDKFVYTGQEYTVLTLSDQRQIILDTFAGADVLTTTNHTRVSLGKGNQLTYRSLETPQPGDTVSNILETGKGAPYVLALAEGSMVWVNAGSKIRYPVSFSGEGVREVALWGEAYFKVSGQAGAPFRVTINGAKIEILGTRFNVKAVAGNSEGCITLIEGKVKVTSQKDVRKHYLLRPLEQVRIGKDSSLQWSRITDTSRLTAWKKFQFDGKSFEQILREIAQWYRLKLPDLGTIKGQPIGGIYSRDLAATTILGTIQTLEHNRIRFGLKGDSLLVRMSP